uniref:Uncharacterized protein n=1 Tax=Triticum urartu TaxID=4572 RepID=A0A8R7P6P3_TRIUA
MESLRSDLTSVASAFCPRAAAMSSSSSSPPVGGGVSCSRGFGSFRPTTSGMFRIANGSLHGQPTWPMLQLTGLGLELF